MGSPIVCRMWVAEPGLLRRALGRAGRQRLLRHHRHPAVGFGLPHVHRHDDGRVDGQPTLRVAGTTALVRPCDAYTMHVIRVYHASLAHYQAGGLLQIARLAEARHLMPSSRMMRCTALDSALTGACCVVLGGAVQVPRHRPARLHPRCVHTTSLSTA